MIGGEVAGPGLEEGQVAVLRPHAAVSWPRNVVSILLPVRPAHPPNELSFTSPNELDPSQNSPYPHPSEQGTATQTRSLRSLGDKPLAVVSAGTQEPEWLELQDDLATLSPNSMHRVVEGATHTSVVYDRSEAQATSAAIVAVVKAVRNDQPLAR